MPKATSQWTFYIGDENTYYEVVRHGKWYNEDDDK
jgi:hypothetical protein